MQKKIIIFCLLSLLMACKQQSLFPKEYMSWIENKEHGLRCSKEVNDFVFTLQYEPLEYIALMNRQMKNIKKEEIDKDVSEMKDMQYYTLKIASKDGRTDMLHTALNSIEAYDQRVAYFSFPIKNDICLLDGNDSLPCNLFHFERNYSLTPYNTFVLAFPRNKREKQEGTSPGDKIFIYKDQVLNTGVVQLTIKGSDIQDVPQLKL